MPDKKLNQISQLQFNSYCCFKQQVDNIEHDGKADGDDGVNNVHKRFYRYCMTWLSKQKGQCGQQYWA